MQVDLAVEPTRRYEMFQAGKCPTVPQVHAKGKVQSVQPCSICSLACRLADPPHVQFVGTLEILQELEDFGELNAVLW